jgi:hypothetical protein
MKSGVRMYYMINRSGFTGNCVVFWAKDHKGYTTDIEKAHEFTESEARSVEGNRLSECAIPKLEVIQAARQTVDFQHLDRKYFKHEFKYFNSNQQQSDLEHEVDCLKSTIAAMSDVIRDFGEYRLDHKGRCDHYDLRQAVERVRNGKPPFEEEE